MLAAVLGFCACQSAALVNKHEHVETTFLKDAFLWILVMRRNTGVISSTLRGYT